MKQSMFVNVLNQLVVEKKDPRRPTRRLYVPFELDEAEEIIEVLQLLRAQQIAAARKDG